MKPSIQFIINGQQYFSTQSITLNDIIMYFDYNPLLLVIEHNGSICSKQYWKNIIVSDKDKIEIVTIVGGG